MRILIIEDEYKLADVIASRLKKEKYLVDISQDGEDGLYRALLNIYDLIILDIMLPKINGLDILKKIKKENIQAKIIMLTAKGMLEDKLVGFNEGANDYITKPFHVEELVARVNVWLGRNEKANLKNYLEVGDLRLDLKKSKLIQIKTNETIDISCKEFLLMEYFMENPGQILAKEQIYDRIWGLDNEAISNNLEAYLSFLRRKLRIIGSVVSIKANRGLGYKLEVNDEEIKK